MEQSCPPNCACLLSGLFLPGNLPLQPDIQLEQDAILSSADCAIHGPNSLGILTANVDTINGAKQLSRGSSLPLTPSRLSAFTLTQLVLWL